MWFKLDSVLNLVYNIIGMMQVGRGIVQNHEMNLISFFQASMPLSVDCTVVVWLGQYIYIYTQVKRTAQTHG